MSKQFRSEVFCLCRKLQTSAYRSCMGIKCCLFVAIWDSVMFRCWASVLAVTVMMHVLPVAFQLPPSSLLFILSVPPLSLQTSLYHLFWFPSILSPHLFLLIFLCFVHRPPSFQPCLVLVQPRPLFPLCLPFPLWCCPLTPHPVLPPSLLPTGTPNLLVLLLTATPLSFF